MPDNKEERFWVNCPPGPDAPKGVEAAIVDELRGGEILYALSEATAGGACDMLNDCVAMSAKDEEAPIWNLRNREKLLQDITSGLKDPRLAVSSDKTHGKTHDLRLWNMEVAFLEDGEIVANFDVPGAFDAIVNDIYWDEEGDWRNADEARVYSY